MYPYLSLEKTTKEATHDGNSLCDNQTHDKSGQFLIHQHNPISSLPEMDPQVVPAKEFEYDIVQNSSALSIFNESLLLYSAFSM